MSHLTPDEIVDALDRTLPPARQSHADECERCRRDVSELASLTIELRGVEVSEPSPLFWDHFTARVRTAIAAEPATPPRMLRWFQWPVLVPLGALAALVLALTVAVPRSVMEITDQTDVASTELTPPDAGGDVEAHWDLVAALVTDVDFDAAEQAGVRSGPGTADAAVLELSAAEQQELMRLLREELEHSGG